MYLGIDYGQKRVGVAIGEKIAFPRVFLDNDQWLFAHLKELILDEGIKTAVVGLPEKDSGLAGNLAEEIRVFANRLALETEVKIVFENENDTTHEAHKKLKEAEVNWQESKHQADSLAAAAILQQYIDNSKIKDQKAK